MKLKKSIFVLLIISLFTILMCSCSRDTMRKGTNMGNDARRGIDNAIRNGENVVDYGMGALGMNGGNGGTGTNGSGGSYSRGGMGMNDGFGYYGANSGYSGYTGNGSTTTVRGGDRGMDLFPTIKDTSRDNYGQINTTNGSSDGGRGDIYDDMNTNRNSLRTDRMNKKFVKK